MKSDSLEFKPSTGKGKKRKYPAYVLVTPARNEAAFIEKTIQSMIAQTVLPLKWVIVSDGSTDRTDEIVKKYAAKHVWIELLRMPERAERHFAGKAHAFNAGWEKTKSLQYDIIGNVDADISFGPDHFEFLLEKFSANPDLGVAGTAFAENSVVTYNYHFVDIQHVSGACQIFRRECFEAIGGYQPRKMGGIDLVAVVTARMLGWHTRTFPERIWVHHRKMGRGMYGDLKFAFKGGQVDYMLGNHPVWEIFRSVYQIKKRPYVLSGFLRLVGFYWAVLKRVQKDVPPNHVQFVRKEQLTRLKNLFTPLFKKSKKSIVRDGTQREESNVT